MTPAIQSAARSPYAATAPRFREKNAVCIEAQAQDRVTQKPVLPHSFQYHLAGLRIAAQAASDTARIPGRPYAPQAFTAMTGARINISI